MAFWQPMASIVIKVPCRSNLLSAHFARIIPEFPWSCKLASIGVSGQPQQAKDLVLHGGSFGDDAWRRAHGGLQGVALDRLEEVDDAPRRGTTARAALWVQG